MAKNYIGIDLGTTETTVSVIEIEKITDNPLDKLRTLDIYQYNEQFEFDKNIKSLQSSIYIDRDNKIIYTGKYAKKLYSDGNRPLNTIRSIKTRLGGESMIEVPLDSDKNNIKNYDMTELSAVFLKTVKMSIDKQISGNLDEVTITVPAGFNSDERSSTIQAARMAGFKNVNLLDEPTAVLLNFLNDEDNDFDYSFFNKPKNIVVYDIGGGTLDISIAKVQDNDGDFDVKIITRSKRMDFGGDNIDKYIAAYFLKEFESLEENGSLDERTPEEQAQIVSRIVSNAEKHKIAFSQNISKYLDNPRRRSRVKESVNFEIINGLKVTDLTLTDDLLKDILKDIISPNGMLLDPLKRTMQSSNLKNKDIDLIILTGGSGKFYLIEETLSKFFKDIEIIEFTKNNAVSVGAAIHSFNLHNEELKKIGIADVMSDSIYIKRNKGFDKLIPHDQETNTKGSYEFVFEDTLDRLDVFLYYGSEQTKPYNYKEIAGVFKKLNKVYKKGEKITLNWEFDSNKTVKIFFNGEELVSSDRKNNNGNELIDIFKLNPFK
jgi:molecular chaperone DnaK (HSP70)